jgi:hypothetical protein
MQHLSIRLPRAEHIVEAIGREVFRNAAIRSAGTRAASRSRATSPIRKSISVP